MVPTLISVVIPTRNRAALLAAAIRSVQCQVHREIEVVVVDDQSKDETAEMLHAVTLQDPRIRVVRGEGRGVAAARNAGLAVASAPWVAFLDDDDLWLPTALDQLLRFAAETGWVVACETLRFRSDDPDLTPQNVLENRAVLDVLPWPSERLPGRINLAEFLARPRIPIHAMLAPRSAIEDAGGFDERLSAAEDYHLWLRLAAKRPVDILRVPLALYRWHERQARRDQLFHTLQTRYALELFLAVKPFVGIDSALSRIARRQRSALFVEEAYEEILRTNRRNAIDALWKSLRINPLQRKSWIYLAVSLIPFPLKRARAIAGFFAQRFRSVEKPADPSRCAVSRR